MDPRRKALLTDGGIAVLALAQVWLNLDDGVSWPLAALFGVATVGATWASEHGRFDRLPGTRLQRLVAAVAVGGAAILGGGLALGPDRITAILLAGLAGLGAGMLCYRTYFGLVRPVPDRRVARARRP
ncbi:hypothetical protein [Haloarcula litorea]|uniref:hypothetical protein n=1 Tax=Haloarcula litorea TaxID=3032579 RepID=UPI0023E82234|nr:hypothetical protein [Halomicroarcula sp. GDY20]